MNHNQHGGRPGETGDQSGGQLRREETEFPVLMPNAGETSWRQMQARDDEG